jgi:hypothetical protein
MPFRNRKNPTTNNPSTNPIQPNQSLSNNPQTTMSKGRNSQEGEQKSHILPINLNGKHRSQYTQKIPKANNPENIITRNPIRNHISIPETKMIDYEQDIYNNTNSWRKISNWILKKWRNATTRQQSYTLPIYHEQTGSYRNI